MRNLTPNNKKRFNKIYIEITNVCNLHCLFCPDTNKPKKFISVPNFKHIIEEIKPFTNLITLHIKGEPLMHPKLDELLQICDDNNILINLTTNGTLLLNNIDTIIHHKSIRQINVSIHSFNENADLKLFNNYFGKLYTSIEKIKLNSNIIISLRLWNITDISLNEKNLNILNSLSEKFNIPNLIEKAKENSFIDLSKNVFLNQDTLFSWPDTYNIENQNKKPIRGTCYGCRNQLGILVDGSVVPCCIDQNANILLGNILEGDSLTNILNSEHFNTIVKDFQNNIIREQLCINCGFKDKFKV